MATKLTHKEKILADTYLDTGNGTLAAKTAYEVTSDNSAAVMASKTLRKVKIQDYLADKAEKAAEIVFTIAQHGESDRDRLTAAKDILDRSGFGATQKTANLNVNYELPLQAGDIDLDLLVKEAESKLKEVKLNG